MNESSSRSRAMQARLVGRGEVADAALAGVRVRRRRASSFVTSSCVTVLMTSGPVMNM